MLPEFAVLVFHLDMLAPIAERAAAGALGLVGAIVGGQS